MTTEHGILSGNMILREIAAGNIRISPFDAKFVNPASVDLHLGPGVAVYTDVVIADFDGDVPGERVCPRFSSTNKYLDCAKENGVSRFHMDDRGFILRPGVGYLMHVEEIITTKKYVPVLDGKSSVGRLFTKVHETAGFGDPDFEGQFTLEVTVVHPVRVYPGQRICQIRFHTIAGDVTSYKENGNYIGDMALGPIPSRLYRNLR